MKKSLRKIIPAIAMLVISATLVGTSTFAWFSMNNKVTISGMSVTTQVSSNLFVAAGTEGTGTAGDSAFHASVSQSVSGLIEPVSTVNGKDFFYTTDAKANGDAEADVYVAYDPADTSAFNTAYNTTGAAGYRDYVIELKAINTDTSNAKYIALTKLDLVYTGTATDNSKAHRVAMFVQAGSYDAGALTGYVAMGSAATCILAVTGAANQTADYAVSAAASAPTAIGIMATQALTSIEVAANSTKYFKVTLRLYLEGEDTTCTNATFLTLTDAWRLESQFELKANATSSITEISKYTAKSLTIAGAADTLVYLDSNYNLFLAADMTQLNGEGAKAKKILTTTGMDASEVTALNTAYSLTGGEHEFSLDS